MDVFYMLAEAAKKTAESSSADGQVVPIDLIWEHISSLTWYEAVLAACFGSVFMIYGKHVFKILVVIAFGLIGMMLGIHFGKMASPEMQLWGGVAGFIILAGVSMPMMKWGVSILGALAGGILTAGLWYATPFPQEYIWAGAIIGMVAGGMMSFIVLENSVMLFTALGGAIVVVIGLLALLNNYEKTLEPPTHYIQDWVNTKNWFLPALLILGTITGVIVQGKFIKAAGAGAGGGGGGAKK